MQIDLTIQEIKILLSWSISSAFHEDGSFIHSISDELINKLHMQEGVNND